MKKRKEILLFLLYFLLETRVKATLASDTLIKEVLDWDETLK